MHFLNVLIRILIQNSKKNKRFDEIICFNIKNDKNIEIEKIKNEINKIFDCDAIFELSNKKIIDDDDVKKFEITNFDFFI